MERETKGWERREVPRKSCAINAPQESNHKRTEKLLVSWVALRSSIILTGANLMEQWEYQPTGMRRMVKWEEDTQRTRKREVCL